MGLLPDWDSRDLKRIFDVLSGGSGTFAGLTQAQFVASFNDPTASTPLNIKTIADRLLGTDSISAANLLQAVRDRLNNIPSTQTGRVNKTISGRLTGSGSIYTVTVGKTLYVTTFHCTGFFSTAGRATWRDGAAAGPVKFTPNETIVANAQSIINPMTLIEPVTFSQGIYFQQDVGTTQNMAYNIIGWEQ